MNLEPGTEGTGAVVLLRGTDLACTHRSMLLGTRQMPHKWSQTGPPGWLRRISTLNCFKLLQTPKRLPTTITTMF
eukprot:390010-Rhodomonas_salina.1